MRIVILFLIITAFVSGCATSKKTYTSDGVSAGVKMSSDDRFENV
jgi:uncharacterized protein YceK